MWPQTQRISLKSLFPSPVLTIFVSQIPSTLVGKPPRVYRSLCWVCYLPGRVRMADNMCVKRPCNPCLGSPYWISPIFSPWTCRKQVLKCICVFRIFKTILDGPVKIIMLPAMSQCYLPWHSHSPFVICHTAFWSRILASKVRISHMRHNDHCFESFQRYNHILFYFFREKPVLWVFPVKSVALKNPAVSITSGSLNFLLLGK